MCVYVCVCLYDTQSAGEEAERVQEKAESVMEALETYSSYARDHVNGLEGVYVHT